MKDRKYKLTITLKSDLCVGSGYSYARVIDSDICYDDLGIPYIPAKRLKGCLREAAELIGNAVADTGGENAPQPEEQSGAQSGARTKAQAEAQIEALFGKAGADAATGLFLENAYIEDYGEIRREIEQLGKEFRRYITPQSILEQFTAVKAQTKIEKNGAAKDNSLRYTRTVSHYSPFGSGDEEKLLVGRAGGFAVTQFRHVERVGQTARYHQQRLVDKIHPLARVKGHQIDQAALRVFERGIRMGVGHAIILVTVTIKVERKLGRLLGRHLAHVADILDLSTLGFPLASGASVGQTLLHVVE